MPSYMRGSPTVLPSYFMRFDLTLRFPGFVGPYPFFGAAAVGTPGYPQPDVGVPGESKSSITQTILSCNPLFVCEAQLLQKLPAMAVRADDELMVCLRNSIITRGHWGYYADEPVTLSVCELICSAGNMDLVALSGRVLKMEGDIMPRVRALSV